MVDKAYIHKGLQRSVNSNYRYDLITFYLDQVIGNICTNYKLGSYRNTKKRLYCYSIGKKFKGINKQAYSFIAFQIQLNNLRTVSSEILHKESQY